MLSKTILASLACLLCVVSASSLQASAGATATFNVRDFGATGNGVTNDRNAFQNAINAAFNAGGGVVFAPKGTYRIGSGLTLWSHVSLEGVWVSPTEWTNNEGTVLLVTFGHGNETADPPIRTWGSNCVIKGLTIYYPSQSLTGSTPVPYPWTIEHVAGDNPSIVDVNIVNPYKAVNFYWAGRHYIRNLHGHPIYRGIYIDRCLDVGRIENVHFKPSGIYSQGILDWINEHGIAFIFARTDWQYVLNTYCSGYRIGYHFVRSDFGTSNGNYLGIGAEKCRYPVVVEEANRFGTLITNGEFSAEGGTDPTAVLVNGNSNGVVTFVNCSFGGSPVNIARIRGSGWVNFSGCSFENWDAGNTGAYAISVQGGRVNVSSSFFQNPGLDRRHIELYSNVWSAVITGNQSIGPFVVANSIGNKAQIGYNIGEFELPPPATPVVDDHGPFTTGTTTLSASWTTDSPHNPISGYQYAIGTNPGGTQIAYWTDVGLETSVTRAGLNLSLGQTYYFSVQAMGEHGQKSSVGISEGITVVSGFGTPGEVKDRPNGTLVGFTGVVTANMFSFPNSIYVQSADRSGGMRAWLRTGSENPPVGSEVNVFGSLLEILGERVLGSALAIVTGTAPESVSPLFMNTRTIGGSDLNPYTRGMTYGQGLYNTGMLVQVSGRVVHVDPGRFAFHIEDGASVPSAMGNGLEVNYRITGGGLAPPSVGQYVILTGISSVNVQNNVRYPLLRLRGQEDILIID